jgi:hypothetical protein
VTPEERTDPGEVRLRRFELEWIDQINAKLGDWPNMDVWPPDPPSRLFLALRAEADLWVHDGIRIGYFRGQPKAESNINALRNLGIEVYAAREPLGYDISRFAREISQAQDDLTDARAEFLTLVFFEAEEQFSSRRMELVELSSSLRRRPWLRFSVEVVDRVAWALDGADLPGPTELDLPWSWRSDLSHPAWRLTAGFGQQVPRGPSMPRKSPEERHRAIMPARNEILVATRWMFELDEIPPEARADAVQRLESLADEDDDLPGWVKRLEAAHGSGFGEPG